MQILAKISSNPLKISQNSTHIRLKNDTISAKIDYRLQTSLWAFLEGPFSAMAGVPRKQPINLNGCFPSLMGPFFPTLMGHFPQNAFNGPFSLSKIPWKTVH